VNLIIIMSFVTVGLILGLLIPEMSRRIINHKCEQMSREPKQSRFDGRLFQIVLCVINGVVWAFTSLQLKPASALLCSILITLAILFSIIDIRIHIIPNELIIITLAVGILFQLIHFGVKSLLISIASMLIMMIILLVVGLVIGLDKVGAGDVKLAGAMGLVLGYPLIMTAVLYMSLAMIAYCVIGIWIRKLTLVSMFPFAPFMMFGMIISLGSILL